MLQCVLQFVAVCTLEDLGDLLGFVHCLGLLYMTRLPEVL